MGQYDCGMGLCHEFGSQIRSGCDHPMRAGASACSCAECGVVCRGLFDGCPDVWARGPRPVAISATRAGVTAPATPPVTAPTGGATVTPIQSTRTEEAKAVRSGAAVAAIGPATVRAGTANGAAGGDRAGGRAGEGAGSRGGETGSAPGDPRLEVFKWFEEAFEGVRLELQTLIASMTHQQAMLAELLDSRQAELRLALVAESLPDIVADAVRAAMDDHTTSLTQAYDQSHDRFRDDVESVRTATEGTVDSLRESFGKLASVIAVHDEEAEARESVRLGTLKGSVTRQITPITDALGKLSNKLDEIGSRLDAASRPAPAAAAGPVAAARPALAPSRAPGARTAPAARPPAAGPAGRAAPSAWAPQVAAGPVVARRVTSNRAAAVAEPDDIDDIDADDIDDADTDDEPAPAARTARQPAQAARTARPPAAAPRPPAQRPPAAAPRPPAAARAGSGPAKRATATGPVSRRRLPVPVPEPEVEPEVEEVEAVVAPPRPRRISTPRATIGARTAAGSGVRPPANGSNGPVSAPSPALGRPSTARVTAPRAFQPTPPEPTPAPTARPGARRRAQVAPFRSLADDGDDEPVVTYELEDDTGGLFDIDDDDAGWAPPAWVSEVAAKRTPPGGGRSRPTR